MNYAAFQVTADDVQNVLNIHNLSHDADEIHGSLDFDEIEEAAMWGDDLTEQTNYACQEIEKQLKEMGILGQTVNSKFSTE